MRKREYLFITFSTFLSLALVVFFLGKTGALVGASEFFEGIFHPVSGTVRSITGAQKSFFADEAEEKIQEENKELRKKLVAMEMLKKENSALRDQFQTTKISSYSLLPTRIVGMPSFIPGVSTPEYFILDKGSRDGVKEQMVVVYKDSVVGKIVFVTKASAKVLLVTHKDSSITVTVAETGAQGVVKGQGSDMLLDNVLLSEKINLGDTILTKGDQNADGLGFPPEIVIGKIVSLNKKPSELFQTGFVASPLDFSKLTTVFIIYPG